MAETIVPDWRHEARTLISAGMGVRETARKLGQDEDKVKQWAWRNGIVASLKAAKAEIVTKLPSVTTAAEVLRDESLKRSHRSKLNAHRYVDRTLHHAASVAHRDPEAALADAVNVKAVIASANASNMPGFEREVQRTHVAVNILSLPSPERIVDAIEVE